MRVPQVRLESQLALISIQSEDGRQEIVQPKATQEIRQGRADVSIRTRPSRLTIDQSQAWHDIGLRSAKGAHDDFVRQGYQKAMQGIARRVHEGNEQMKIENGGNPLTAQATRNAHRPQKQFNIGFIPSVFSVKTDYQPAEVDIRVEVSQPMIRHTPNKPIITYTPGSVTTGIRQENDLIIDYENLVYRNFNFEMSI